METIRVKIDFVTAEKDGSYRLVLVEGPWEPPDSSTEMERLSKRVADAATAVLTGEITARFPAIAGRSVTIQLDSYDTPRSQVDAIIAQLRANIESSAQIQAQLKHREFVSNLQFEHNWFDWQAEFEKRQAVPKRSIVARVLSWLRA